MGRRRLARRGVATLGAVCVASAVLTGAGGLPAIKSSDLKEWLSYIASDELQGRVVYTAGIGLAARGFRPSGAGGRGAPLPAADLTTVQRLDSPIAPSVTPDDRFFDFVFSHAPTKYEELKRKAAAQELLPSFALDGVRNYEFNDPSDNEQLYTRSDHYSYAVKGIPIIFFTTGLHPDYHANTDEVSKIEFEKLTRITQLVFETGLRVANLDHAPARDNKGPRAGRLTQ